ncbi:MAG TPA: hypothetical protein VL096_13955, partial [Pirellulaceae bacterium]|nr:hypothetical protein [Pirellulaceae bacterium]
VGISPQGDRIAVLRREVIAGRKFARVVVFEITGRIVHESAPVALATDSETGSWDAISWSPLGNRLLLWVDPPQLYDLDRRAFELIDEGRPSPIFLAYRLSPFLPDGSGVILQRGPYDGERMFEDLLVRDSSGKSQPLVLTERAKQMLTRHDVDDESPHWPEPARWQAGVARLAFEHEILVIDPDRLRIDAQASAAQERFWNSAQAERWSSSATYRDATSRLLVRRQRKNEERFDILFQSHPAATATLLAEDVKSAYSEGSNHLGLFPSPDGRYVAIKYTTTKPNRPRLMIVNEKGEKVSDGEM